MRDYIADQATLRLARTSNFVTAARPAVTDAVSAAINTPPVADAIRDFAQRAHEQVFEARAAQRVDIDAQQTATSVRSALQSINPALAKKLPANVLDASATISQNDGGRRPVPGERLDLALDPDRRCSGSSCWSGRCGAPPTRWRRSARSAW